MSGRRLLSSISLFEIRCKKGSVLLLCVLIYVLFTRYCNTYNTSKAKNRYRLFTNFHRNDYEESETVLFKEQVLRAYASNAKHSQAIL